MTVSKNEADVKILVDLKRNIETRICDTNCKVCNLKQYIHSEWREILSRELSKEYFARIIKYLHTSSTVYPPTKQIFSFTHYHSLLKTKIVILGQDPYHNKGQAMGLSFSVNPDCKIPKSLQNIYKEIKSNYDDFIIPRHGNLTNWAKQGVLLLNYVLTVFEKKPDSHKKIGWQNLVSFIIKKINNECESVVFMLWGKNAEKILEENVIDKEKHLVLVAPHPSPFSANKGFFGCGHFRKANDYLVSKKIEPIDWKL